MIEAMKSWCARERESLLRGLDLMERGVMRTGEQRDNGVLDDTAADTMADYRRKIAEIEELQRQMEEED